MSETNRRTPPSPEDQQLQDVMNTYPLEGDPRPQSASEQLRDKMQRALERMHLTGRKELSSEAIRRAYPNLINVAHFEDVHAYNPTTGEVAELAGFTLWTTDNHVMLADGSLAKRPQEGTALPEGYDGLIVVTDQEIDGTKEVDGYSDFLKTSLSKTIGNLAVTMPDRTTEPTKWADKKVTRALLRKSRRHISEQ